MYNIIKRSTLSVSSKQHQGSTAAFLTAPYHQRAVSSDGLSEIERIPYMTLNQLQYFYQAAKTQHFNHAADNLSISQPSLSRAIASLENELGVILFERMGRNVSLTKAGQVFLEQTEKILEDIAVAERKMHQLAASGGEISIAYVFPLSSDFIPSSAREFIQMEENQGITFTFAQGLSAENIDGLKNGKYDVIFGTRDPSEMSIRFVPVMQQNMVVIMPAGHELSEKEYIEAENFKHYPVLTYDRTSGLGKETRTFFRRYGVQPKIICESPDENGIASLVRENFGIALVADIDYTHLKDIVVKPLAPEQAFSHTVYMGYLAGKYQIPAVSRYITFIQDNYSAERH